MPRTIIASRIRVSADGKTPPRLPVATIDRQTIAPPLADT